MSTPLVHLHVEDRIATLTITRPKALNALNTAVINALHKHVVDLDGRDDVRVVLLTGEGEKSFVAGADIAEFATHNQQEGQALAQRGQDLLFTPHCQREENLYRSHQWVCLRRRVGAGLVVPCAGRFG